MNGTLTSPMVAINGGTLNGAGTVAGAVTIAAGATIQAGDAPGTMNINGALTINGTLGEAINSASSFDALNITGTPGSLTLGSGSTLDILLASGYNPVAGASFTIAGFTGGLTGTFGSITNDTFNGGAEDWSVAYNSNDIVLTAGNVVTPPTTVTATWSVASGNWTTATEWACTPGPSTCVPDNGTPSNTNYDAALNSSGNTLMLNSSSSPASVTINTLALTAGTLDIGSGATLNLASQPNGLTDIAAGTGLSLEGTFTAGSNNALAGLTTVEGALTVDNGQTASVTPGGSSATLTVNGGTVTVSGASTNLAVNGDLTNDSASTVQVQNGGAVSVAGDLTNSGMVSVASGTALTTTNAYDQTGSGADTEDVGTITTYAYDMAGGTTHVQSGGNLNVTSGTPNSNNLYDATGGTTQVDGKLTTYAYDAAGGATVVTNGGNLTAYQYNQTGSSTNTTINKGGTVTTTYLYSQSNGTTDVDGTLITPSYSFVGGTLTGTGTVQGNVSNTGGTLDPGDEPGTGTFTVTGNYSQGSGGMLMADVNGGVSGSPANGWDVLDIGGTAMLGGTLDISINNGFLPTDGEMFQILDATGGLNGTTFASIMNETFGSNGSWNVLYGTDTVTLEAKYGGKTPTPEPASLLLFGTGLLGVAWIIRRRRVCA